MAVVQSVSELLDLLKAETLSENLTGKITNLFEFKDTTIDEFKTKYERLRVDAEQKYFDIEQQLITSNNKLETESTSNEENKRRVEELEKKYNEAESKRKSLQESQDNSLSTNLRLSKSNEQLELDKRDLSVLLEKRNKEIDRINEEWKELTDKVSRANTEKCEAQAKLAEVQNQSVTLEFQNKRLEQEKSQIQRQLDLLDKQMFEKTNELLNVKKEQTASLLETQSKLEEKIGENTFLQETVTALKSSQGEQATKIDGLIQKLKDARNGMAQSEDQFNQELQAKSRLIDLYKTSKEEAESKVKELTSAVEELRTLLKEAASAHKELEESKEEEAKHFRVDIESREETIEKLRQELVSANDLLEQTKNRIASEDQVESMFPTAAVTSKVLKSGMSLTQIYNEYVQASDALMLEKEENQRLNHYLSEILQEIEEKAPLLKKQRQDYENSLANIDQMTRQLDASMLESQNLRLEADDINRKYNHMQRENQKLQLQTNDLSKQLRYLLKEMAELRGGRVVREVEQSSPEVSSSSQVISDKLVTFRTIEDLQVQNIRLLTVIRELSDKQEQEEKMATDTKTKELKEQLQIAHSEIQELKSSRDKQVKMVESIVRQRDLFKVLSQSGMTLSQSMTDGDEMSMTTPVKKSPVGVKQSPSSDKALQDMKTALTQLQEDFNNYKKEKKENEKIMDEEIEKYRNGLSSMTVQHAKMSSQVDYTAEKYKVLQGNAEGYRKEIAALRDKVQKYSASVAKHEQTINILRQDLMSSKENFARSDTQAQNLRIEKELLKQSEQRLLQDVEAMRRERHSQAMLMANLEAIKNNIERSESETRNRYTNKIDALEMENNNLTRKLHSAQDEQKTITTIFESQIKEIRSQLEQELENHEVDKKHLRTIQQEVEDMKNKLGAAEAKVATAEMRLANTSTSVTDSAIVSTEAVNEEVKDLQSQLEQSQHTVSTLRDQLSKSQDHITNYKAIADGLQKTMDEQSMANNQFEQKFEEMLEAKKHAEQRTEDLEKEHQDLLNENIRVSEESHKLNADLRKQLACLQNELQEAVQRREDAIAKEAKAIQENRSQTNLASEVQDKYQRELILHAADVEALTIIKKQMEEHNEKLAMEQECRIKAEKILEESKGSWLEQEKTIRTESGRLQKRIQDFSQQNNLLHQQIEKMSRDVVAVQQAVARNESFSASSEDTAKSSEQLLEVVKFLRREKEIAETKLEIVQSESKTVRQQLERVQRSLEEANDAAREEREHSQTNLQTAAQHAELMRKVENLNLLTDSNRLLRDEKTKLEQQVQTLEAKVVTLEQSIDPLQSSVRDSQSNRDAIGAERDALRNEVERWKSRTNHLIEQANKTDPEEHRKLILEKENIRKEVIRLTEENHRTRSEVSRISNSLTMAQRELSTSKQEIEKLQRELNASKQEIEKVQKEVKNKVAECEAKDNDSEEKTKTINQLKKIGRKYKEQAEAVRKELDDLQTEQAAQSKEPAPPSTEAIEQAVAPVQDKLTATEKERDELKQRLEQVTTESNTTKEQSSKLQQELTQSKEESSKVKEENAEYEKKLNQSRNVLQAAKKKIGSQNEQIEKISTEMNDLKQKLSMSEKQKMSVSEKMKGDVEQRLLAVRSEMEEKLSKMEKELSETRATKESAVSEVQAALQRAQEENTELQTKIQQLQKQIESQQTKSVPPQPQVARPSATVTVERVSAPTSEAPKTANIRPMASPVPVTPRTQPAQIQPQSAATKATASIRPMAIAPTTVAPSSGPTPTATVMPTTVSVQDNQDSSQVSQLSPALARPTQHVQRVTPQVESGTEQAAVVTETEVVGSHTETVAVDPQPSTSAACDSQATGTPLKRSRDDMEGHEEETDAKRTRVSPDQQTLPSITVTDEHANTTPVPEQGGMANQDPEVTGSEVPSDSLSTQIFESSLDQQYDSQATVCFDSLQGQTEMTQEMAEEEVGEEEADDDDDDDDAVIVVESDEEDDEDAEDYDDDDDNEGYNEEMGDYDEDEEDDDDEPIQDDDYQELPEGQAEEGEDEYQTDSQHGEMHGPGDEADDEVVIVDDEDNDNQMEPQEPEVPPVPQVVAPSVQTPVSQRSQLPFHAMERQMSVTRTQLAPFVLGGQAGGFEDGEDCIVPSTPTLFVPNRGDGGFAEAVSSPQIPHQRFTFTSSTDPMGAHHDLGQLESQEALGMDDTQMDLSQLEEGQGHSVPTTPVHQAPTATPSGESFDPVSSVTVVDDSLTTDSGPENLTTDTGGESAHDPSTSTGKPEQPETSGVQESESATAGSSASGSDIQSTSFGQAADKSEAGKAKKIQPIVWEQTGMPIQTTVSHSQPMQHLRGRASIRGAGQTRGMMQHPRGHRGYNRPRAPTPRGTRIMRGGRGGNYRPPMY